ncbi:LOW QUALITY PROTEIN: allantoin permease, partial [Streptomyces sp. SPB78]
PDGRVELDPGAFPADSPHANEDLRPIPVAQRHWGTYNFTALWIGMAHNIPSWTLASGLVALGMDWKQAVLTIALANVVVLLPMLLTGHAGPKYGIPFPVLARASFGCAARTFPRSCGRPWPVAGSASRRGSAGGCLRPARQAPAGGRVGRLAPGWAAVAAVGVLRDLLAAPTPHHPPGDGDAAALRELGRALRVPRRARAARVDGRRGGRFRPAPRPAVAARLGRRLLARVLPRSHGDDRLLVHALAEHSRFHAFREGPTRPGLGAVARPAHHDDGLRAPLRA